MAWYNRALMRMDHLFKFIFYSKTVNFKPQASLILLPFLLIFIVKVEFLV